jgi:hypothetical protein
VSLGRDISVSIAVSYLQANNQAQDSEISVGTLGYLQIITLQVLLGKDLPESGQTLIPIGDACQHLFVTKFTVPLKPMFSPC